MNRKTSLSVKQEQEQANAYLAVLELQPGATLQDIKSAYRDFCLIWHPDKNPARVAQRATAKLQALNEAYTWLVQHPSVWQIVSGSESLHHTTQPAEAAPSSPLRVWWNQLAPSWKIVFIKTSGVYREPSDEELQRLVRLDALNCSETEVADLSPLTPFTSLKTLECYQTPLHSLMPLSQLLQIENLDLWGTPVSDLRPLESLIALRTLNCNGTQIRDLSPLRHLNNLRKLACSGTPINTLAPLSELVQLESLSCGETSVESLDPLERLTQLRTLYCSHTSIDSLKPLWNLPNLQTVFCQHTRVPLGQIWEFEQHFPACKVYS